MWKRYIRARSIFGTNVKFVFEDKLKNRCGIEDSLQRGEE
jgi:hypothetical protein